MSKKRIVIQILEILAGIILLGLGIAGKVDEFWSGMGGALIGVAVCIWCRPSVTIRTKHTGKM